MLAKSEKQITPTFLEKAPKPAVEKALAKREEYGQQKAALLVQLEDLQSSEKQSTRTERGPQPGVGGLRPGTPTRPGGEEGRRARRSGEEGDRPGAEGAAGPAPPGREARRQDKKRSHQMERGNREDQGRESERG
ncbi:unnamed protein product [Prorocentrum cordatum]|uniref:Uncharacterized protein n=1 Tax=Prorocentrum cordatum TaxID=2364126 RepID=A0ABN9RZI5_9DINO|nr:unnamed protein product [Polarella glacialis]